MIYLLTNVVYTMMSKTLRMIILSRSPHAIRYEIKTTILTNNGDMKSIILMKVSIELVNL